MFLIPLKNVRIQKRRKMRFDGEASRFRRTGAWKDQRINHLCKIIYNQSFRGIASHSFNTFLF